MNSVDQFVAFRLIEASIDKFDPKICCQHLQECLKKCLVCYDRMDEMGVSLASIRRDTIESMYLLFNLGNAEALTRFIKLPAYIR